MSEKVISLKTERTLVTIVKGTLDDRHANFRSGGRDRVPHARIERYIDRWQLPAVFLRTSFFMQNLNTTHSADIRDRD